MKPLGVIATVLLPGFASAEVDGTAFGVDARNYDGAAWSPYLVGAGIGVLSWLTFYFADRPIGASSFYATIAGFIGKLISPRHMESLKYFQKTPPRADYGFFFVVFTIVGGFIAAWTGGEFRNEWLHPMWLDRFGDSLALRVGIGFAGGVLMAFGARLAGGCTSGHGIFGVSNLELPSLLSTLSFMAGGIATTQLLYRVVFG